MAPLKIDYTKAVVYKIVCRDVSIIEKYVGSTTNLRKRRWNHKHSCNNPKSKEYNYYVYQFIRDHGGFDNWQVVLVENVVDCSDSPTLHARERCWVETLQAELNKQVPTRTHKEYRDDNREKIKEYNYLNREYLSNKKKQWYENNREHRLVQVKEWQEDNREHYLNKMREYGALNRDKINKKQRETYALNRDLNRDKINKKQRELYALKKLKALGSMTN